MMANVEVMAINQDNFWDRLVLCWGHLDNWRNLEIVQKSKQWLEETNMFFSPTTFVAYKNKKSIGMLECLPQNFLKKLGLCPCRIYPQNNETEERYILGKQFENYLFISCLFVSQNNQGKGVGKALLNHFLNNEEFKNFDGAIVYVAERNETWDKYIHWPAGPKEFYLKAGFVMEKMLDNPIGYMLVSRKGWCKKGNKTLSR